MSLNDPFNLQRFVDAQAPVFELKFRSSMTLFAQATSENEVFIEALRKYFGGKFDRLTLERL